MLRKRVYAKAAKKAAKRPRVQKSVFPTSDLGPELKHVDTTSSGTFDHSGGSPGIVLLNGIVAGTGKSERVGRKILMKSLELRIKFQKGTNSNNIRMLIVYDKQANQTLPTCADVVNVTTSALDPYQAKNLDNAERFVILKDVNIDFANSGSVAPVTWFQKIFLRLNLPVRFDSTAGGYTDITSGSLVLMFFDNNSTGSAYSTCYYGARVKYSDL